MPLQRGKGFPVCGINILEKEGNADNLKEELGDLLLQVVPMLTDLKIESNMCPAPGTYWGEVVNLFGYDSGVIKCNVFANKERLMAIAEEGISVSELDAAKEG